MLWCILVCSHDPLHTSYWTYYLVIFFIAINNVLIADMYGTCFIAKAWTNLCWLPSLEDHLWQALLPSIYLVLLHCLLWRSSSQARPIWCLVLIEMEVKFHLPLPASHRLFIWHMFLLFLKDWVPPQSNTLQHTLHVYLISQYYILTISFQLI